jgi:hypothetical protein
MSIFNKLRWRTLVEIVGIISIVGSLIFVGAEIRQAERSAQNERRMTRVDVNLGLRDAINSHADIWLKGNRGEPLEENESLIYENILRSYWGKTISLASTRFDDASLNLNPAVNEFSWFLYKNPGARKRWIEVVEREDLYMRFLSSNPGQPDETKTQILINLERLDKEFNN